MGPLLTVRDQVLLMITRISSRYVMTDITLFDSLFCLDSVVGNIGNGAV